MQIFNWRKFSGWSRVTAEVANRCCFARVVEVTEPQHHLCAQPRYVWCVDLRRPIAASRNPSRTAGISMTFCLSMRHLIKLVDAPSRSPSLILRIYYGSKTSMYINTGKLLKKGYPLFFRRIKVQQNNWYKGIVKHTPNPTFLCAYLGVIVHFIADPLTKLRWRELYLT
jgi:hypothetical protein